MRSVTAIAMLVLLAAVAVAGEVRVSLRGACLLPAGDIPLGQVAAVSSGNTALDEQMAAISLGATPWPGNGRVVTRDNILMHLARAGVDAAQVKWQGPESCTVTVQTVRVTGRDVVQAARDYLMSLPMLQREDVHVDVDQTPRDQLLAAGERGVTLSASAASVDKPWGRVRVYVRLLMDDKVVATVPVTLLVTCRQKVLYAVRPITRGEYVDRSLIEEREVILGGGAEPEPYVTSLADAVGKKTVRAIPAGSPITASMIAEPFAIHRGENVSVLVHSDYMEIVTKGVAQRDARVGEVTPIKVLLSGKEIACKVISNGSVELPM